MMGRGLALAGVGLVLMTAALGYGFLFGDGWNEVRILMNYPWFIVSLVDVYVGFAMICGWIWFRETSPIRALTWTVLILVLGNAISCLYVLLALFGSHGNWNQFWTGE